MAKYSDAQKEATARYNKKAYDRIDVVSPRASGRSSKPLPPVRERASTASSEAIAYQMNQDEQNKE